MKISAMVTSTIMAILCASCATHHHYESNLSSADNLTLGKAQRELRKGMDQASVASAMGSPNIVTKDSEGRETWIYDKIAREVSYSSTQGGIWFILAGVASEKGYSRRSERTLTVLVKFDEESLVESVTYHSSSF